MKGYAEAIEDFDARIPEVLAALEDDDLLLITADHEMIRRSRERIHTREYVPLLAYSKKMAGRGEAEPRQVC